MPFVEMPGVTGLVWQPEKQPSEEKKHPCADCFSCQWCDDERCALCLKRCGGKSCAEK
jgi:hypothetical protein